MAMALGGAALIVGVAVGRPRPGADSLLGMAVLYERVFWAAAGVLVMTGIGNLAAFGPALPPPASAWGSGFMLKLIAVGGLIVLSIPRTVLIGRLCAPGVVAHDGPFARLYIATAAFLIGILAVAVWLAHG